jgi:hypothetical protein
MEQIGLVAGFVLTLMIFSYILGDNFLYRLAVYVFVGLAAAFVAIVTWQSVIVPFFNVTLITGLQNGSPGDILVGMIPILLGLLLLFKGSPYLGRLGNLAIAFIVGVGAAVALVGALTGTLIPLTLNTGSGMGVVNTLIVFLGVISSLVYFQYLARRTPVGGIRRNRAVQVLSTVGQGFIVVTLGALYAAAIITSLTIFSERVGFILLQFSRLGGG